MIKLVSCKNKG